MSRRLALLFVLAAGCATPSRRLPARAIDDPITLPRRMMAVSLGAYASPRDEYRERELNPTFGFAYGITDRLTWNDLLMLEFAVLDDAPVEHAATGQRAADAPFGLSLQAGLSAFGFSSTDGTIVAPSLGVSVRKRLGRRFRVFGNTGWHGSYYSDAKDTSRTYATGGVRFQLLERVSLVAWMFDVLDSAASRRFIACTTTVSAASWVRVSVPGTG